MPFEQGAERPTLWLRTSPEAYRTESIERAVSLLRGGGLVAFPTETVYGLGAVATNAEAVEGIFVAKERPHSDPLIVHIADSSWLPQVTNHVDLLVRRLSERFWPGPLTLIVPRSSNIPALVSSGGDTVGVRVPAHEIASELIRAVGSPLAAPSANRFMHTSPTTAEHVLDDLGGRIDAILDGGRCAVGVESTVLDVISDPPRILRLGGVTLEELRAVEPRVEGPSEMSASRAVHVVASPGQMERHYAPHTPLIVFDAHGPDGIASVTRLAHAQLALGRRVGVIVPDDEADELLRLEVVVERLGPSTDLRAISRNLYAALRRMDSGGVDVILAHTFGESGLAAALRDRLRRAAGGSFQSPSS